MSSKPTAERVRDLLHYDPETGLFRWKRSNSRRAPVGALAGATHKVSGYIFIGIDGAIHRAHRLAWVHVMGEWPVVGIDHRDGVPNSNRWNNLRLADAAQNMQNLHRAHRDSKSGLLGVTKRANGKWVARVSRLGIRFESKPLDSPEAAHRAYLELKAMAHPFSTIGTSDV